MKLKTKMYWAAVPIAALLLAGVVSWNLLPRAAPVAPVSVVQGEVELRVAGPGTVQARVPVTVAARVSAQVLSVHADHGERVKRGQLLALLDDRDLAAKQAAAVAGREASARNVAAAEANVAKAQAELELARSRHRRDAELYRAAFISQSSTASG